MGYSLTENQKKLARFLVEQVRAGNLPETFYAKESKWQQLLMSDRRFDSIDRILTGRMRTGISFKATIGSLDSLAAAKMINQDEVRDHIDGSRRCTLTGLIYEAVANNFAEASPIAGATGRPKLTYVANTAFILMWMDDSRPELEETCSTIKEVCATFGIKAERADDIEHQERVTDVVLEHIRESEFLIADKTGERPNVYYEIGYAHALGKHPILYRKEGTKLHFDLSVHNVPGYRDSTHLKELLTRRFEAILGRPAGKT